MAPRRLRNLRTFDQLSCLFASPISDGLLWRSLAALATSSYVCCTLRPVSPSVNFGGRERLELAVQRHARLSAALVHDRQQKLHAAVERSCSIRSDVVRRSTLIT